MFLIISCLLSGIIIGWLLRKQKLSFLHRIILTLIWLLLFLLGLQVGCNKTVVLRIGEFGWEGLLLATGGTLGSVVGAWLLWMIARNKNANK